MTSSRERLDLARLDERRRNFERSLSEVRHAFGRELGALAPRRAIWAIPIIGVACGVALALGLRRRKRRLRTDQPDAE